MEDKKYICIEDLQGTEFMVGKAMTILEWKCWLLEEELERLCGYGDILDDDGAIELYQQHVAIKTDEVIPYIEKFYELKIIPLEDFKDGKCQYFIEDTGKFIDEDAVRKMLFDSETNDLYDNYYQYKDNTYNLDCQFDCIKNALKLPIEEVIKTLNASWNIPIKKIY